MLQVEPRRILIGFGKRQKLCLPIELTKEGQAHRSSRTADAIVITVVFARRLGGIRPAESVRQNHGWMASEIGRHKLFAGCWSDDYIQVLEEFPPQFHRFHTRAICLDVLDRWRQPRDAKRIRPIIRRLLSKQLVAAGTSEVVKSSRRFSGKQRNHRAIRKFGNLYCDELHPHFIQLRQRGLVEPLIVLAALLRLLTLSLTFLALLHLFRRRSGLLLRRLRFARRLKFELIFEVSDPQL